MMGNVQVQEPPKELKLQNLPGRKSLRCALKIRSHGNAHALTRFLHQARTDMKMRASLYPPFRNYYAINSSEIISRNDYANFAQPSQK